MSPPNTTSPALACMQEIQEQCFKLGIPLRTRHREVAPNQVRTHTHDPLKPPRRSHRVPRRSSRPSSFPTLPCLPVALCSTSSRLCTAR